MIRLIWIFSFLSFLSCWKTDVAPATICHSDSTSILVKTIDFYSAEKLPGIKLQVFERGFWSYGPRLFKEFISDSSGSGAFQYTQDSLSGYYLEVLPSIDTTHIYPWRVKVAPGCNNDWKILMKPAQTLTLTLKNDGSTSFGQSYIFIVRRQGNHLKYQNDDIIDDVGYTFGNFQIDTVPIGFERKFMFKVIPREELEIQFGAGAIKRVEKIFTGNSNSDSFIFSIK